MDDEDSRNSLGAYENMERSDIRPDFYSEEEGEKQGGNGPGAAARARSEAAKGALRAGERAAASKAAEKGLNAVSGGAAGAAMKAAKGAEAGKNKDKQSRNQADDQAEGNGDTQDDKGKSKLKTNLKRMAPLFAILALVMVLYGALSFVGQWLFPIGFKSREVEDWNSTKVSATERTDALTNNTQLGNSNGSSKYVETVFDNVEFTDNQIKSLAQAGIEYKKNGGTKALVMTKADGAEMVVVADSAVGIGEGGTVAEGGATVVDAGTSADTGAGTGTGAGAELSIEEKKNQILADLDISATGSSVVGFSEAMADWSFKEKFMIGARSWRGDISGWFSEMTETVVERLGISRNNYKDFVLTGDNDKDEKAFIEMAKTKAAADEEVSLGDTSLEEKAKEIAEASDGADCGAISTANYIEGMIAADQTVKQVSAGSLWLEAIDKTMAGQGSDAPLSVANNIIVRSGSADTEGMHHLFGGGELDQKDANLLSASAQANIGANGTINLSGINEEEYRECAYEGNTNVKGLKGAVAKIGSMFNKALSWVKDLVGEIVGFFKSIGSSGANAVTAALDPTIAKYNQMKEQHFFTGDDTAVLGEALVSSAERIMNEKAKTAGQVVGDNASVIAFYREQQEVIAEQAEFDKRTKSPFDITSEHTFLGSLAYSMIPMTTSTQSGSVTSAMGKISNLFASAINNLLPSSSAISETDFNFSRGDCVLANSLMAISDGYCNNYYITDSAQTSMVPTEIYNTVADLRFDNKGYRYGTNRSKNDPEYGEGALNSAEDNMASHWGTGGKRGEGTPHGCESDWRHKTEYEDAAHTKPYEYYFFDEPTEWAYSRVTNFEYDGYQSGWHNRLADGSTGVEEAKNEVDPGSCLLDVSVAEDDKQPIINMNGALMSFMIMSGQRGSEWGSADDANLQRLVGVDFTKGRLHPCTVGASDICDDKEGIYKKYDWDGSEESVAKSKVMSRWIGGTAYTMRTAASAAAGSGGAMYDVYEGSDEVFKDPTRDNDYFWNEQKYYQAYTELLEWMQTINRIQKTETAKAVAKYYEENPLDNSYEGIIARYSGMSKEKVVAVLELLNYMEFLAQYDPSEMYPLGPLDTETEVYYEELQYVAYAVYGMKEQEVVYDEVRNRAVAV